MAAAGYPDGDAPDGYMNEDPAFVTAAYDRRVREFLKRFVTGGLEILGKVKHMWGRTEVQLRGSPHFHVAIWLQR